MRELNSQAFWKLIAQLDSDPDRAGEKYESLRHRLIIFFEGRSCGWESETLTDRTLDRVAGKLLETLEVDSYAQLAAYSYGVARYILKEWMSVAKPDPLTSDPVDSRVPDASATLPLDCLEKCLKELAPESRKLILDYYEREQREKIERRARLAEFLGI